MRVPRASPPAGTAKGFTLVELLVVVLILTVVAAIVVPQIAASVDDARLAALDADLARLRNAIELYRQEHGAYPGSRASAGGSCAGRGGTGTTASAATRAVAVAEQLTLYSSSAGKVCSIASPSYRYGPYLKSAEPGEARRAGQPDHRQQRHHRGRHGRSRAGLGIDRWRLAVRRGQRPVAGRPRRPRPSSSCRVTRAADGNAAAGEAARRACGPPARRRPTVAPLTGC